MVSYSSILMEFIQPLLTGTEDADEFLHKARVGQIAWNFSVSDQNKLPLDSEMKNEVKRVISMNPELKDTLNMLVIRKSTSYQKYNQFIFTVEKRHKPDGSISLYVESAPADKIKRRLKH